ncbi:MAG: hypothetical protein ABI688_04845 [Bacteroidota bacterium]
MSANFYHLCGYGKNLTTLHVCVRSFLVFFIAIALLRIVDIRIFGKNPLSMRL